MSIQYYPNGVGGSVGDSLDTCKPLQTSGNVWYVSSLTGTDAAAPAGQNREKPLATIAQAVTNAADDDIIVFLQGHTQTLVATQTIAKRLTLIGEGTTAGKPGVSFIMNAAATLMFAISGVGAELRNIYFPPNAQANTQARVSVASTDVVIKGCYFECGATDAIALLLGAGCDRLRIDNTTFISVATSTAAQPLAAIVATPAIAVTGLTMNNVVVSAGTAGFSNYSAISLANANSYAQVKIEGLNLLLGADVDFGAAKVTGRCNVQLATGGSRVNWS